MASITVIFRLALATILENRLRSVLTLLGMIFGNAAVIATLSSNEGAQVFIASQLASLGNKLMTVVVDGVKILDSDLAAIDRHSDEIEVAVRERVISGGQVRYDRFSSPTEIRPVDNNYFEALNLTLSTGRQFANVEISSALPVVILGAQIRGALFAESPIMNEFITLFIDSKPVQLRVIGAFKEKGGTSGVQLDRSVFIVPSLGQKLSASAQETLLVLLKDDNRSTIAKYQLKALLSPKFGNSIQIADAREAIERTKAIWGKQNFVGICLAGISLLTGGVGIMNIMLLSIHQRQKEIGLRKAVGAQNSEIAFQFLLETVIICVIGGLLGVAVGWGFGQQVARMLGDWQASMSVASVFVALGFSVLTGIVFGAAPAMRAARIDPYDALRTG